MHTSGCQRNNKTTDIVNAGNKNTGNNRECKCTLVVVNEIIKRLIVVPKFDLYR